jgi:hypothetical protein
MGWLHGLLDHGHQVSRQRVQVRMCAIAQCGAKGSQRLCCVVLAAVKTEVNAILDAPPQWIE